MTLIMLSLFSIGLGDISKSEAYPINFEIVDLYASVSAHYYLCDGSDENSLFEVERNGLSASQNIDFDLGLLSGIQVGEISASPTTGTVTASGFSNTVFTSLDGGKFTSWGKHVVVGSFEVPNTGSPLTDVFLDITYEGQNAYALFRIQGDGHWAGFDLDMFFPDVWTPWFGVKDPQRTFTYSYSPGDTVFFAFGIEPGVGVSGCYTGEFTNSDFVSATFQLSSDVPIPEPSTMLLLGTGLAGLFGIGRKRLFKS